MALGDLDTRWKNPQGSTPEQLHLWAQDLIKELRKGDYLASGAATGSIENSQLADMPAWTIKLRNADTDGVPQDVTIDGLTSEGTIDGNLDMIPIWDKSIEEMRKTNPNSIGAAIRPEIGVDLLASGTVSAQATLDIPLTTYTAYRAIKFVLTSFVPATDDSELWMRFSTDGGSSYNAGATDYSYAILGLFNNATSSSRGSAGAPQMVLMGATGANLAVSNVATEGGTDIEVTLFDQSATRFGRITYTGGFHSAQSTNATNGIMVGAAGRLASQDTDAVRFMFESGNITSGNYAVYGLV